MDGRTDENDEMLPVLYFFQRKITVELVAHVEILIRDGFLELLQRIGLEGLHGL